MTTEQPKRTLFVTAGAAILDIAEVIAIERHLIGITWRLDFHLRSGALVHSWHASQAAAEDEQVRAGNLMEGKGKEPNSVPPDPSLN